MDTVRNNMQEPLLAKLGKKKSGQYGDLSLPYIIAVNTRGEPLSKRKTVAALFGKVHHSIANEEETKAFGGFWTTFEGAENVRKNTTVSAVLVVSLLQPFSVAREQPVLWHNPWAAVPLDPELWRGPQVFYDQAIGALSSRKGTPAHEILGLDANWPYVGG